MASVVESLPVSGLHCFGLACRDKTLSASTQYTACNCVQNRPHVTPYYVDCMGLQAKGHEMEVMAKEKALAEALAAPVSACLFNMLAQALSCHHCTTSIITERPGEKKILDYQRSWIGWCKHYAVLLQACFTAFLRTFCARLKSQYGKEYRLGSKIGQVEQFCAEVGQHLLVRPHTARWASSLQL